MKEINYSIICEDLAHATFIFEFLKIYSNNKLSFKVNQACYEPWKFKNKSNVLSFYREVSARWFSNFELNLLFIIVDYDDWLIDEFDAKHDELINVLNADFKNKTFILLPVRAIEHWLYHLSWRAQNPGSTKNIRIENIGRKEMKELVYGTKRPHTELTERKVKEIMDAFDSKWLVSRSRSFKHFYTRFASFLST